LVKKWSKINLPIKFQEQEARTKLLRARARSKYDGREDIKEEVKKEVGIVNADGHVNFFAELEQGLVSSTATNKEHDEELKQEREKYEKQIGYLTYLGQGTNEASGNVSWYNKNPDWHKKSDKDEEIGLKHKLHNDPLTSVKQFCFSGVKAAAPALTSCFKRKRSPSSSEEERGKVKKSRKEKKKQKKSKHKKKKRCGDSSESDSSDSTAEEDVEKRKKLEKLRAERIRREEEEKKRSEKLLAKVNGLPYEDKDKPEPKPAMLQKYNSQFNPTLARQNYRD